MSRATCAIEIGRHEPTCELNAGLFGCARFRIELIFKKEGHPARRRPPLVIGARPLIAIDAFVDVSLIEARRPGRFRVAGTPPRQGRSSSGALHLDIGGDPARCPSDRWADGPAGTL